MDGRSTLIVLNFVRKIEVRLQHFPDLSVGLAGCDCIHHQVKTPDGIGRSRQLLSLGQVRVVVEGCVG
jgi:hypothetical protein